MKTKNTLWLIAIIALIGFVAIACDTQSKDDSKKESTGNTKLRVSNEPVEPWVEEAAIDGNYGYYFDYETNAAFPLSDYITGTPKVEIANKKLTLELDAPKDEVLQPLSGYPEGITVTPTDAKLYNLGTFSNEDGNLFLHMEGPGEDGSTYLVYVDKDVKINGTENDEYGHTITYNASLKKGWNYMSV